MRIRLAAGLCLLVATTVFAQGRSRTWVATMPSTGQSFPPNGSGGTSKGLSARDFSKVRAADTAKSKTKRSRKHKTTKRTAKSHRKSAPAKQAK